MYDELEKTWVSRSITEKSRRGWEVSTESWPADFDRDNFIPTDITRRVNGTNLISEPMEAPWLQQTKRTSPKTWNEYVVSLPSWEKDLIGINHEMENMTGLCSALINESTILFAVSDGGNVGPFGSFGWVVGTTDEIMWEGAGVARGSPMTSYRAEAYGYLALTCFIS